MKTTRRNFIRTGTVAVAGVAFLGEVVCETAVSQSKLIPAVQLYCVRDDMKVDPLGSLTKLAKMGYTHVEHANYVDHKFYGWIAEDFKRVLDNLGSKKPSGHTVLAKKHWDEQPGDLNNEKVFDLIMKNMMPINLLCSSIWGICILPGFWPLM